MPDGHLQRADESKNEAIIIRKGRRFVAAMQEVERAACVVGARVHFDIDRRDGVDRATNVRLVSGTRTNKRQRRFGDLTGAKLPGAKVKSTSSSHLGVDVTTQPKRVIDAWLEAMAESRFDDATSLYAPNGVLHTPRATKAGRKTIRATLEDEVSTLLPQGAERSIVGEDLLVHVRFHDGARSVNEWFEVYRGAILEHWHEIAPDLEDETADGPAITIIRSGEISEAEELRLRGDLQRVAARLHGPVEEIRVKIDTPSTPSHPYSVTGAIHAGTLHVRSHVTAPSFAEAIDGLSLRLRSQVERSVSRHRRPPDRHRPDGDSWRHADRPSPDEFTALGPIASSREIVRHKAWGPKLSTIEEAIWDMDQADYDFFLFTEEDSRSVGLVWHGVDGIRAQLLPGGPSHAPSTFATMELRPAPTITIDEAKRVLDELNAPFVFARTPSKEPFVLYRRYDGHFGLIEPRAD